MANIVKRSGKYYVRIRDGGKDIIRLVGTDKKTAQAVLAQLQHEMAMAKIANEEWAGMERLKQNKRWTFAEIVEEYMQERTYLKDSSHRSYNDILKNYLLPEFGQLFMSDMTEGRIAKLQARLAVEHKPTRVNNIMNLLRCILRACVRRKILKESPADGVRALREPPANIDPLSLSELTLALSHVAPHFRPLFVCLAWTGARPNELLALRWADVDFVRNEIRINKGRVKGIEGLTKTRSSERFIPMLPPARKALEEIRKPEVASLAGYVFTRKNGRPINQGLDRIWWRALKSAGLRHRPSYQLRHTFASLALEAGESPGWVAKVLGHTSLEMLYRHYARWINDTTKVNGSFLSQLADKGTPKKNAPEKSGD